MKTSIVMTLIAMLLLAACVQVEETPAVKAPETIKIGAAFPLTGDASSYGLPLQKIAELAREEINNAGGINGKHLEIVFEDSKCNAKDAATAAQKLISVDKVPVIIALCSGEMLGAAPITEENKVVLFSPSAGSPDITKAGDYVFRNFPSDSTSGRKIAEYANAHYPKVAIIAEVTDYAQGLAKVFKSAYTGELVADESYNSDQTDFRAQFTKIKAKKPDAIYIVSQTPQKFGILLKQKHELGMGKIQLIANEFASAEDILRDYPQEIEGALYAEPLFDDKSPAAQELFAKIKAKYGEVGGALPPVYWAIMYDAMYIFKDALSQSENTDDIKAFLYNIKDRQGTAGTLSLDQNGDAVLEYTVRTIQNGKPVTIK